MKNWVEKNCSSTRLSLTILILFLSTSMAYSHEVGRNSNALKTSPTLSANVQLLEIAKTKLSDEQNSSSEKQKVSREILLKAHPKNDTSYLSLAYFVSREFYENGQYEESLKALHPILSQKDVLFQMKDSSRVGLYLTYALSLCRVGEFDYCIEQLTKLLNHPSAEPIDKFHLHHFLAILYQEKAMNEDEAKQHFQDALSIAKATGNTDYLFSTYELRALQLCIERSYLRARSYLDQSLGYYLQNHKHKQSILSLSALTILDIRTNRNEEVAQNFIVIDSLLSIVRNDYRFKIGAEFQFSSEVFFRELIRITSYYSDFINAQEMIIELRKTSLATRSQLEAKLKSQEREIKQLKNGFWFNFRKPDQYPFFTFVIIFIGCSIFYAVFKRIRKVQKISSDHEWIINSILYSRQKTLTNNNTGSNETVIEKTDNLPSFDEKTSIVRSQLKKKLRKLPLLTEDDFLEFKECFEDVYPGFIERIHQKLPELTNAELRLVMSLRLHLSINEIASNLGISPNSVRRTSLRLRAKHGIDSSDDLSKLIHGL